MCVLKKGRVDNTPRAWTYLEKRKKQQGGPLLSIGNADGLERPREARIHTRTHGAP